MTVSHFVDAEHEQSRLSLLNEEHPAAFAATHEGYEALRWRVPIDDTNTMHFTLYFAPIVDGKMTAKMPKDQSDQGLGDSTPGEIPLGRRDRLDLRAATRIVALRKARGRFSTAVANISACRTKA